MASAGGATSSSPSGDTLVPPWWTVGDGTESKAPKAKLIDKFKSSPETAGSSSGALLSDEPKSPKTPKAPKGGFWGSDEPTTPKTPKSPKGGFWGPGDKEVELADSRLRSSVKSTTTVKSTKSAVPSHVLAWGVSAQVLKVINPELQIENSEDETVPPYPRVKFRDSVSAISLFCAVWTVVFELLELSQFYKNVDSESHTGFFQYVLSPMKLLPVRMVAFYLFMRVAGGVTWGVYEYVVPVTCAILACFVGELLIPKRNWVDSPQAVAFLSALVMAVFIILPVRLAKRPQLMICLGLTWISLEQFIHWSLALYSAIEIIVDQHQFNTWYGKSTILGLIMPSVYLIFETVGWIAVTGIWQRWHGDAPPILLSYFAAFLVCGGESLRIVSMFYSLVAPTPRQMAVKITTAVTSMTFFQVLTRMGMWEMGMKVLWSGEPHVPTAEDDMYLQVYLGYTYLPHICCVYIPCFAFLCGDPFGTRHMILCSGFLLQLFGQYVADIIVITWQGRLHTNRVGTAFGRETRQMTYRRLQTVGGHLAPQLSKKDLPRRKWSNRPTVGLNPEKINHFWCLKPRQLSGTCITMFVLRVMISPIKNKLQALPFSPYHNNITYFNDSFKFCITSDAWGPI